MAITIASSSSVAKMPGTVPALRSTLTSSSSDSSASCESPSRTTQRRPSTPARRRMDLRSSRNRSRVKPSPASGWKSSHALMCDASLATLCRPEPPTPTRMAWPRGCARIRQSRSTCSMTPAKSTRRRGRFASTSCSSCMAASIARSLLGAGHSSYTRCTLSPAAPSSSGGEKKSPHTSGPVVSCAARLDATAPPAMPTGVIMASSSAPSPASVSSVAGPKSASAVHDRRKWRFTAPLTKDCSHRRSESVTKRSWNTRIDS
mmetsp:Transcript_4850/g.20790  ORF Transcript_4850/g.20790 Transcript_4850/m.20790 type:complete len:261 (-) Transcript_4850:416-1198(-)